MNASETAEVPGSATKAALVPAAAPARRWMQFGLRALLLVVVGVSLPLGWLAHELRCQRLEHETVREIRAREGTAMACAHFEMPEESWIPRWMQERVADEEPESVNYVSWQGDDVTDEMLERLGALRQLRSLQVHSSRISDAGLACLQRLPTLECLSLSRAPITDRSMAYVCGLSRLESLSLDSTRITDAALADISRLRGLKRLSLENTQVTDAGIEQLAQMPELLRLELSGSGLTDRGLEALARLPSLQELIIRNTGVTDAGVAAFRRRAPHMKVER